MMPGEYLIYERKMRKEFDRGWRWGWAVSSIVWILAIILIYILK